MYLEKFENRVGYLKKNLLNYVILVGHIMVDLKEESTVLPSIFAIRFQRQQDCLCQNYF